MDRAGPVRPARRGGWPTPRWPRSSSTSTARACDTPGTPSCGPTACPSWPGSIPTGSPARPPPTAALFAALTGTSPPVDGRRAVVAAAEETPRPSRGAAPPGRALPGGAAPPGHRLPTPPDLAVPVTDGPVIRTLRLVINDEIEDWRRGSAWSSGWCPGPTTWPPSTSSSSASNRRWSGPGPAPDWSPTWDGSRRLSRSGPPFWCPGGADVGGLDASGKLRKQQSLRPKEPGPISASTACDGGATGSAVPHACGENEGPGEVG